jgi:hypothetical protein
MPKRGLLALVLTIAGVRAIIAYTPPAGGGVGPGPSASGSATGLKDGSFVSDTINNRYGQISATVVIASGKISTVTLHGSWNNNFGFRSGCSIATYTNAAIGATTISDVKQTVNASFCSGATESRTAYLESLQSALDKAAQ